jgi:hypothetical protein
MAGTAAKAFVVALTLAFSTTWPAEAAAPIPPGERLAQLPRPADSAAEEVSIHGYGDRDKTCQEWTDGCRTCRSGTDGQPVCGNIGPACQPKPITCTRRNEQAK